MHRMHNYIKYLLARHSKKAFGANSVEIEPMLGKIELEAHNVIA